MKQKLSEKPSRTIRTIQRLITPMPTEIEAVLHWVYHTHLTHKALLQDDAQTRRERQAFGRKSSADGCVAVAQIGELGVRVDSSGGGTFDVPEVCITIHKAVLSLGDMRGGMVFNAAVSGTRPDWMPGAEPKIAPVLDRRGEPVVESMADKRTKFCPLVHLVTAENIEAAWYEYEYWWDALADLVELLIAKGLDVTVPAVPRNPWFTTVSKVVVYKSAPKVDNGQQQQNQPR